MPVYEQIGQGYDQTRRADPYIVDRLAHHLQVQDNGFYLDAACGTGNYTLALAERGGRWSGLDQSQRMVEVAQRKSDTIPWLIGEIEALPYSDRVFDGVLCVLAIHHFKALQPAFREVYRVLADGRFVIFTATPEQMQRYWLNEYFPNAMRQASEQMPRLTSVTHALRQVGFTEIEIELYFVQPDLQDGFLYSHKHQPEKYLDPVVRTGISTFALFATETEVKAGCQQLAKDINTGTIIKVMQKYHHDQGDYLFIVAEKS